MLKLPTVMYNYFRLLFFFSIINESHTEHAENTQGIKKKEEK